MKNKYENYDYWKGLLEEQSSLNLFSEEPLSTNSIFFHGVIVNCHGQSHEGWLHLPNFEALIGFMNYVFVPAALSSLSCEDELLAIPASKSLEEIISDLEGNTDEVLCFKVKEIKELINELKGLWKENKEAIQVFKSNYDKVLNAREDRFTYFETFSSTKDFGEYLVRTYENDEIVDIKTLEKQIGLSKEEWLKVCSEAETNEEEQKKFMYVLNNHLVEML